MKLKGTNKSLRFYPSYKLGITLYQEGGQVAVQEAPQQGQDPIVQIIQMAAQAVQTNDMELAMEVCKALVALVSQSQQQGAQPAPEPQEAGEEEMMGM